MGTLTPASYSILPAQKKVTLSSNYLNFTDSSGNDFHGTPKSAIPSNYWDSRGLIIHNPQGPVLATQYIEVPDLTNEIGNTSWTLQLCYNTTDIYQQNGRILGNCSQPGLCEGNEFGMVYNMIASEWPNFGFGELQDIAVTQVPMTNGKYNCHTIVYDRESGQVSEYIRGVKYGQAAMPNTDVVPFNGLVIGASGLNDYFGAYFTSVDDFKVWNYALTDQEVANEDLSEE